MNIFNIKYFLSKMKKAVFLTLALAISQLLPAQNFSSLSSLKSGTERVGFRTFRLKTKSGEDILVSLWYPAESGGKQMTLRDYVVSSSMDEHAPDTVALNKFKSILELPFLFHLDPIPVDVYNNALSISAHAWRNAPIQKKRFPLIVGFGAEGYIVSNEFFASHGYCVATIRINNEDVKDEHLYYVKPTAVLGEFLDYMCKKPFIDTAHIAAMGHGWGIQAPFYLSMKSSKIKQLINLDGGVFVPRSKTTLSPDYVPSQLRIPMLQITTVSTRQEEDLNQLNALTNRIYRINISSDSVLHHDFTTYGRVVGEVLGKRPSMPLIDSTFNEVHRLILYFLKNNKIDSSAINNKLVNFSSSAVVR